MHWESTILIIEVEKRNLTILLNCLLKSFAIFVMDRHSHINNLIIYILADFEEKNKFE